MGSLGYSNGVLCYLPTAEAYPPGGWDVGDRYRIPDMVFQSYLLPVALAPDSEERIRTAGRNRIVYRDGVPLAVREGDFTRELAPIEPRLAGDVARALRSQRMPALA